MASSDAPSMQDAELGVEMPTRDQQYADELPPGAPLRDMTGTPSDRRRATGPGASPW